MTKKKETNKKTESDYAEADAKALKELIKRKQAEAA